MAKGDAEMAAINIEGDPVHPNGPTPSSHDLAKPQVEAFILRLRLTVGSVDDAQSILNVILSTVIMTIGTFACECSVTRRKMLTIDYNRCSCASV
jgi:hypothetical protein